jgi:hypothetical protein
VLPAVGDVLQFEVKPGVALLFRVVASEEKARCVVLTKWVGAPVKRPPRAATLFAVQPLKHHAWDRPMIGGWVNVATPQVVTKIGNAKVKPVEAKRVLHPKKCVMATKKTRAR